MLRPLLIAALAVVSGCSAPALAPDRTPHQAYADALADVGLDSTRLGRLWLAAARPDADTAVVALPAARTLEVDAARPSALALWVRVRPGETFTAEVAPALGDSGLAFVDLLSVARGDSLTFTPVESRVSRGDTVRVEWSSDDVGADVSLVLRVQPELLADGGVGVRVAARPSLGFPVAGAGPQAIRSVWGDPRDGGARRHEGVDIFADRGTPVVATSDGVVNRVQETPIGGRVVWLRPSGRRLGVYYAHLDSQLVASGQRVRAGDTLGLVGNTGNARSTPPHLHFGVYASGGAVDPDPFIVGRPSP